MTISTPKALPTRRFRAPRTILALILREMQTTYGRNPGGYVWAVVEPVAAIALFTLVIAIGLKIRTPSIGTIFVLFYATGYLPFALFQQTSKKAAGALRFSRPLLFYPGVRYTDAIIARFLLNFVTHAMVFYIIMAGIYLLYGVRPILDVPAILTAFVLAAVFGLGVGVLNCFLISVFPVWEQGWAILTRPLLLLSTVIYSFEDIPWVYQDWLWYNPLVQIIGLMRRGFFSTYDATYVSVPYVLVVSLVCLALGLVFLNRYHRDILNF